MASTFLKPLDLATFSSDPASPPAGYISLYMKTDGKLYAKDSAGTVTQIGFPGPLIFTEEAAPGTPPSGKVYVYAKTDGKIYRKDDTGAEAELSGTGGGGLSQAQVLARMI